MHRYRDNPTQAIRSSERASEELILYGLLVVIGAIPVAIALIDRSMFRVDATLGLLMVCAGVVGMLCSVVRSSRSRNK